MKNRKIAWIIAGVLGVAGVGLMPFYPPLWLFLAYTDEEQQGVTVYLKRSNLLPGPRVVIPPVTCPSCEGSQHDECFDEKLCGEQFHEGEMRGIPWRIFVIVGTAHDPRPALDDFRCTCTHPSHAEDR